MQDNIFVAKPSIWEDKIMKLTDQNVSPISYIFLKKIHHLQHAISWGL